MTTNQGDSMDVKHLPIEITKTEPKPMDRFTVARNDEARRNFECEVQEEVEEWQRDLTRWVEKVKEVDSLEPEEALAWLEEQSQEQLLMFSTAALLVLKQGRRVVADLRQALATADAAE